MAKIPLMMIAPPVIFAALAGLFFGGMQRENPAELPSQFVGQLAPPLTDEVLPGTPLLAASDLSFGEVTIVNFWASWCPPCRAEHPVLKDLAAQGYRIAGVNYRDTIDDATKYLGEDGNPFFAMVFDPRGRIGIDWGVTAPPETFIIGRDGVVLFRFVGPLIGSDYEQRFLPELAEAVGR